MAMVATAAFILKGIDDVTLALCVRLLDHAHDLIQEASGWMLREVGKKDTPAFYAFLHADTAAMPRTMLRYSIENCPRPIALPTYAQGAESRASLLDS
jgi:3-methyladenine DNA glycosylase AlkD